MRSISRPRRFCRDHPSLALGFALAGAVLLVFGSVFYLYFAQASLRVSLGLLPVPLFGSALLLFGGFLRVFGQPARRGVQLLVRGGVCIGLLLILLSFVPSYLAGIHNPGQLVFSALAILGILGSLLWNVLGRVRGLRILRGVFTFLYGLGLLAVVGLTLCMVGGAVGPQAPDGTTVLVLGSKVSGETPSADLQARIDTAAAWLAAHPSSQAIACGGQGANESISEAEAIRRGLLKQGIAEERIALEDRSTSTEENIRNAIALLPAKDAPVAILTDDYHVCRGRLLAQKMGLAAYPAPSRTPGAYFPAFYARELLALPVELLGLHGLFV